MLTGVCPFRLSQRTKETVAYGPSNEHPAAKKRKRKKSLMDITGFLVGLWWSGFVILVEIIT